MIMWLVNNKAQVTAWRCMYDLESEWPTHNQGKTPGWLAGEKTQYNNIQIHSYSYNHWRLPTDTKEY